MEVLDSAACEMKGYFKIFIYIVLVLIVICLLPVVPFILISYYSF